ncbi:hypothetical protein ElyMa_005747200 [Elysia marginata]|uniref:Uncharacterized protein n=1 Tax=Elysia marginata TaxID=1093978 RepID=A0AAV4FLM0_9GAST|nr:hypothetical protein ElyMa_005747200 [Elysia marginata]
MSRKSIAHTKFSVPFVSDKSSTGPAAPGQGPPSSMGFFLPPYASPYPNGSSVFCRRYPPSLVSHPCLRHTDSLEILRSWIPGAASVVPLALLCDADAAGPCTGGVGFPSGPGRLSSVTA